MTNAFPLALCGALLLLAACQREQSDRVLARVGGSELTLEEALAHVDSSRRPVDDQLRLYVARWVNDELLYQEAKKNGADKWPDLQRNLRDARRQLTAEAYLRTLLDRDTAGFDASSLDAYFSAHAGEFFVREPMMKLNLIVLGTREQASAFGATVSRGTPWAVAVEALRRDSTALIVSSLSEQFVSQHTLYPAELWKVATTLGANEISFPVKVADGYGMLQPLALLEQGKPAPLDLVRDEVRQRMVIERRRRAYTELIGTLRSRYDVEIVQGSGLPDTAHYPRHD
jgi:peptidyl-prolyl cis-trans isomerase C